VLVVVRVDGNFERVLLGGHDADEPHIDDATRVSEGIHEKHYVDRIAVLAEGARNRAEIEWTIIARTVMSPWTRGCYGASLGRT